MQRRRFFILTGLFVIGVSALAWLLSGNLLGTIQGEQQEEPLVLRSAKKPNEQTEPLPQNPIHSLPERVTLEELAALLAIWDADKPAETQAPESAEVRNSAASKIRAFRGGLFPPALSSHTSPPPSESKKLSNAELYKWAQTFLGDVEKSKQSLRKRPLDPSRRSETEPSTTHAEALAEALLGEYEIADRARRSEYFDMLLSLEQESLPALLRGLRHPHWEIRRASVIALGALKTSDERRRQGILMARHDASPWVRLNALKALAKGIASRSDLEAVLFRMWRDKSPMVRKNCIDILGAKFVGTEKAQNVILKAVTDPAEMVCLAAVEALGMHKKPKQEVIRALAKVALDGSVRVRQEALVALEGFGPQARAALPEVSTAMDDEEEEVQAAAERAYASIQGP